MSSFNKEIDKAIPPKDRKGEKFGPNSKDETKDQKDKLDSVAKSVAAFWKKVPEKIEDKVDLVLDDVESGMGDNNAKPMHGKVFPL